MKKLFLLGTLILFLCFISVKVDAKPSLTKSEANAEILWQVTSALDMLQTFEIVEHGDIFYETNPILGDHPNKNEVLGYFLVRGYAHYWVTTHIAEEWRWPWLLITNFVNYNVLESNHSLGVRISF